MSTSSPVSVAPSSSTSASPEHSASTPSGPQETNEPPRVNGISHRPREASSPSSSPSPGGAFHPATASPPEAKKEQTQQGFRMQVHVHKAAAHRKRKRGSSSPLGTTNATSTNMSSSSSSSSDEDELDTKRSIISTNQVSSQSPDTNRNATPEVSQNVAPLSIPINGEGRPKISPNEVNSPTTTTTPLKPVTKGSSPSSNPSHASSGNQQRQEGWRVKLYRLNADGSWDDCGTGRITCMFRRHHSPTMNGQNAHRLPQSQLSGDNLVYEELGDPTLCMRAETNNANNNGSQIVSQEPRILLRTRILLREAYQRQGDTIITWCEPYLEEGNATQGVDLALSFQDKGGCLEIWRQITQVQKHAAEIFRRDDGRVHGNADVNHVSSLDRSVGVNGDAAPGDKQVGSVEDVANAVAVAHHANLHRQQQQEMWVNVAVEATQHHLQQQQQQQQNSLSNRHQQFEDSVGMMASYHDAVGPQGPANAPPSPQLPNPPTLPRLEEIADTIASVQHMLHAESLTMYIAQNECSYLKSLLSLFPSAEQRGDYGSLATLAACVKTILLLNDVSIIELIVTDELIFEEVCATLEYDPDLRDKADHRWFLRERAKFRTVVLIEDEELIAAIHKSFRVQYLRDTLLRPTMDEGSLSTLSSLQTFTHSEVVKGVTVSPAGADEKGELLRDSYLAKVIRMLGRELEAICEMEWEQMGKSEDLEPRDDMAVDTSTIVSTGKYPQSQKMSTIWKQHLAPQDPSLPSRRVRRRGCLSFLRELFNMVRISLQQSDKDDFFAVLVSMEIDLQYDDRKMTNGNGPGERKSNGDVAQIQETDANDQEPSRPVNLLSLLGTVLADPTIDVTEKGSVLEIISGIAMLDPSLIRRRCLDFFTHWKKEQKEPEKYFDYLGPVRPNPNEKKQIIYHCPPNDLLGSLMFLLAVETDAGVLLQVSEIMRIILDTDMMGDHGPMGAGFADEAEGIPPGHNPPHDQHVNPSTSHATSSDQNQFLSMYYEHYVHWLTAPFQYKILHPVRRIPSRILKNQRDSRVVQDMISRFEKGHINEERLLRVVVPSAIRSSFAIELVSFCIRAHLYRMKCYLLRTRVLGNVLKLLQPAKHSLDLSGDRCLKLAALRFFRAVLSVNDEFYHRHIMQQNLFALVFDAFRQNPVGDNLVSSAIVEMCDFIKRENIQSLLEHIVTKHMATTPGTVVQSLEDVSSPYVSTFSLLRQAYEKNLTGGGGPQEAKPQEPAFQTSDQSNSPYFHSAQTTHTSHVIMNEKAREDQRKFRAADQEESYFDADDDEGPTSSTVPMAVDEYVAPPGGSDLHRKNHPFTISPTPILHNPPKLFDGEKLHENGSHPPSKIQNEKTEFQHHHPRAESDPSASGPNLPNN